MNKFQELFNEDKFGIKELADAINEMSTAQLIASIGTIFSDLSDSIIIAQVEALILNRARDLKLPVKDIKSIIAESRKDKTTPLAPSNKPVLIDPEIDALLTHKGNGEIASKIVNFRKIMELDPFYKGYKLNELTWRREVHNSEPDADARVNPFGVVSGKVSIKNWDDSDEAYSMQYLEESYGLYDYKKHNNALSIIFNERRYNPLLDILNTLDPWDETPRAEEFFIKYGKAEDSAYNRFVSRVMFDGAFYRAQHPGCKFEFVPVLIGNQGCGKSTLARFLAINDNFFGEIKEITDDNSAIESLSGKWIMEMPEMVVSSKRDLKNMEKLKAFISRMDDDSRLAYEHYKQSRPRRCIFIGTTNRPEFYSDLTGGRRWLPIKVNCKASDIFSKEEEIRDYILKCYAETRYRYENKLISFAVPTDLEAIVQSKQKQAQEEDIKESIISEFVEDMAVGDKVCTITLMKKIYNASREELAQIQNSKRVQMEIKSILRSIPCLSEDESPTHGKEGKQRYFVKTQPTFTEVDSAELPF